MTVEKVTVNAVNTNKHEGSSRGCTSIRLNSG